MIFCLIANPPATDKQIPTMAKNFLLKIIFLKKVLTVFDIDAIIILVLRERRRNIAQSGSASALGAGGRKFESCYSDH